MSAGTQEPLAVARVTAFLDVRDAAPKRPVILGSIRANVIEEREGKVLFSDDLRFLLSALTKAEQERDEAVKRAEKAGNTAANLNELLIASEARAEKAEAERDAACAAYLDKGRAQEKARADAAEARAAAMEAALNEASEALVMEGGNSDLVKRLDALASPTAGGAK